MSFLAKSGTRIQRIALREDAFERIDGWQFLSFTAVPDKRLE
jgi:hypothetical protein